MTSYNRRPLSPSLPKRFISTPALLLAATLAAVKAGWSQPNVLLNFTGQPLPVEDQYKRIDYAVVGQQKCGTSSLWNQLTVHPDIRWVGIQKEPYYWSGDHPSMTMCDKHLEPYQREAATWRLRLNRTDILVGDWSASYFSCICCPPLLKTLNPNIKIIVMLRDPVDRSLSRFVEQKRVPNGPFRKQVENTTFAEWSATELASLRDCLSRAERFRGPAPAGAGPFTGWGAGWTLGEWMEAQCLARSNLLGWSVYSVFLGNWLAHVPPERLLVLYTVDLSADPLAVLRRVESFLGVKPHMYDSQRLGLVFNARDCYNWRCSKPQKEVGSVDRADGAAADGHEGPFRQAHAELVRFFRPYMQRLFSWADQGKIAQVPPAWRSTYA